MPLEWGNDPFRLRYDENFGDFKFTMTKQRQNIFTKHYSKYIVPSGAISYGVLTRMNKSLRDFDVSTRDEIGMDKRIPIDDYMQYAPATAVFGLSLAGIKAKHNFRDRIIIMTTSYLVTATTVHALKRSTKVERPDGSNKRSFPSGHTATAFVGAHMLFKEYKDVSPWIGIMGYSVATATGTFRVLNKKHWVSDVITGAGIGILSAEVGYLMLPVWHKIFGIKNKDKRLAIAPAVSTNNVSLSASYIF